MLRNYFLIAIRNLLKNKVYSFINVGGLAVGMSVALLIGLWIHDELSYDTHQQNYDRVGQVMQQQTLNGEVGTQMAIPFPLEKELRDTYGGYFKYLASASWEGSHILTYGDKKLSPSGLYMGIDAPKILSLRMKRGTLEGLKDPHSILLSESTAQSLFGNMDPINKVLRIDNKLEVKVTGVYENVPNHSRFREVNFIAPWDLYVTSEHWLQRAKTQWGNNSFQLFVQIADHTDFETVSRAIVNVKFNKVSKEDQRYKAAIFVHPMTQWHLYSNWDKKGYQTGGAIEYVWLFAIIGVFVLLLACINFMNLSTARSEKRAKEVGIRKAIGSIRQQLITQFFTESLLVVLLAFALAILIVEISLPWFNQVANKEITFLWKNPYFWLFSIGFMLLTSLLAGSYPALYLSSFQPVKVLKGTFRVGQMAALPRKVLVVLQFTVSITLMIGTVIVYQQVQYSKSRPAGFKREGLVMIQMKSPDFFGKYDVLRNELKRIGAIEEMTESSSPLTDVWSNSSAFSWQGKDPNMDVEFATIFITHDYGKTVGWQFLEGRDLSTAHATDSSAIILNESAAQFTGIKDPVGKVITWGSKGEAKDYTIIGVVKDMVVSSPYAPVKPAIYFPHIDNFNWMIFRLNSEKSTHESLAKLEAVFKRIIPAAPFDYQFADASYGQKFAAEEQVGTLAGLFAILAILISCLGLFGLASFVAEQRTKEIGVRKVLGASVLSLWQLLSKDFIVLVLLSCGIAIPMAYYFMADWLEKYEYRTTIHWWVFIVAGMGALIITLITVSYQAITAALMNPVKSLKSE
ncbi:ABC transporter permease [Siphonobacter sp. SORGH_AS_0500]|uniref:ABC transporter permease n=1 Tax=Siphonobacter sp. SORGH_AS_0500 TaxID=1864824 RepID=UPI00285CFA8E|nr:ABC transporter permease [Siphonobacter sp. SORGH_AS_0500]MDR6196107.1 putative ABC transport system permease protein [Siphonobacter sp. SORGH_AS_0500]